MAHASLAPRLCLHCGAEFTSKVHGTKYCGRACWLGAEYERRKVRRAAEAGLSMRQFDPTTGLARRTLLDRQCDNCGKQYRPKDRRSRYCSRACAFAHPGWRAKQGEAIRMGRKRAMALRPPKTCKRCAGPVDKYADRFCRVCRAAVAEENRVKRYVTHTVTRTCIQCGDAFLSTPHRKYCSATCSRLASVKRRASRVAAVVVDGKPFSTVQVHARDKWRCHICGIRTPRTAMGTLRNDAPHVDHVMPLSQGGLHVWSNVKTACRACNLAKLDAPLGQFGLPFDVMSWARG